MHLLSPSYFNTGALAANGFALPSEGYLYGYLWVTNSGGVRAVINLSSEAQISGGIGTANSPYEIKVD